MTIFGIRVIRLLGSETAQTLMATYLRKGEQLHSYLTGLHLQKGADMAAATLTTRSQKLSSAGQAVAANRAMMLLGQQVQKQANVLAYIDAFWLTVCWAAAGLVVLAFVRKAPKGPLTSI